MQKVRNSIESKSWYIDNLSMRAKLFSLAGVLIFIVIKVSTLSLWGFSDIHVLVEETASDSTELLKYANEMDSEYNTMRVNIYRAIALGQAGDETTRDEFLEIVNEEMAHFEVSATNYANLAKEMYSVGTEKYQLAENLVKVKIEYLAFFGNLVKGVEQGNYDEMIYYINENRDIVASCVEAVDNAKLYSQELLFIGLDDIDDEVSQNITYTIIMVPILILISIFIALMLSNEISNSIKKLELNVERLQRGAFDEIENSIAQDEIGNITRSVVAVADTINNVVKNVKRVDAQYESGDICPQMKTENYSGEYAELAKAINNIFITNQDKFSYVIAVAQQLAAGEFNIERKTFPGEQVVISDALFMCLDNILSIDGEISKVIENVAKGNIVKTENYSGIEVKSEDFDGEWKHIAEGVGNIVTQLSTPLFSIYELNSKMAIGDLSARMEGNYVGQLAEVQSLTEACNSSIQSYITEIEFILSQLSQNKYNVDIEREYVGDFTVIRSSLLDIIEQLNSVMGEISDSSKVIATSASASAETSVSLAEASTVQNQEITTLLGEIDEAIGVTKTNADNAEEARSLSHSTLQNAKNGNEEMKAMLTTINEISVASKSIENIIDIIEDIAFQKSESFPNREVPLRPPLEQLVCSLPSTLFAAFLFITKPLYFLYGNVHRDYNALLILRIHC